MAAPVRKSLARRPVVGDAHGNPRRRFFGKECRHADGMRAVREYDRQESVCVRCQKFREIRTDTVRGWTRRVPTKTD